MNRERHRGSGVPHLLRRLGSGLAAPLLLAALTVAVYAQVRHHDFVEYDDQVYVARNPHLDAGWSREGLAWAFAPYESNWIPLTWLSFLVEYRVHGRDPAGYHLTNLALHVASTLLLFQVLAGMTGARGRSAFVAGVFAVHPLHVESVAWVAERKDVLSGLFWMLTLWAYARHARSPSLGRYAGFTVFLVLGLMAKVVLVTLPFVLLLLDFWPLGRLGRPGRWLDPERVRRAVLEKLPLVPVVAGFAAAAHWAQSLGGSTADFERLPLVLRLENALIAYVAYLAKAFWPTDLAVFYPHPLASLGLARPLAAAILLLLVSGIVLWRARPQPYLLVGWAWFVVTLLPMIGLVQIGLQARADRYTYLPLIGIGVALAWSGWDLLKRLPRGPVLAASLLCACLGALGVLSWQQVRVWRSSQTLFTHALRVTENNYVAHGALGEVALREGRADEAVAHLSESVRIQPRWPALRGQLGDALRAQGRLDLAVAQYAEAVRRKPGDAALRGRYGQVLLEAGRHWEAIRELRRALAGDPGEEGARMHALLASAYVAVAKPGRAISHYQQALELDPELVALEGQLVALLLRSGRAEEAQARLREALREHAESPELQLAAGDVARHQGEMQSARVHYAIALRLRPDWAPAANNLAWLLASDPDPELRDPGEAVRLAELAARDTGRRDPGVLDTLAVSYAAAGRFEDALHALEEALELAAGDGTLTETLQRRRELFRQGRPFVEAPGDGTAALPRTTASPGAASP